METDFLSDKPKWKRFEEVVAKIQSDLAEDATVTPDDRIIGKSGTVRKIDISIRKRVGQFELLVVIDCKDHASPIDINVVRAFRDLLDDVGAHKGALVSAGGYTKGAKDRAVQLGIDIYRLIDTGDHDWKTALALPALIEFTGPTKMSLSFRAVEAESFYIPENLDLRKFAFFDEQEQPVGTARDLIGQKWNAKQIPQTPGVYRGIELAQDPLKFVVRGRFSRARVSANVTIESRLHFGYWPVSAASGFFDEANDATITRSLELDVLSMQEVEQQWQRVDKPEDLQVRPVLKLRAFDRPSPDDPL
jgi:hypothetical protein